MVEPADRAAVAAQLGTGFTVLSYHEHALSGGADARAVAYVELRAADGRSLFGAGMDDNIVSASLKAIVSGLNRLSSSAESGERIAA